MKQSSLLFDIDNIAVERTEIHPHFANPADTPRLAGQNRRILDRLRQGPATNVELAEISLKYTSRISDVRSWLESNTGETITCQRGKSGVNIYGIERKEHGR